MGPAFTPAWMKKPMTTVAKEAYYPKPPSYTHSKAPERIIAPTGPAMYNSTHRDTYPEHKWSESLVGPRRPDALPPKFTTKFSKATTTGSSFVPHSYGATLASPSKSYAPTRSYVESSQPLGNTTSREFYVAFSSKNVADAMVKRSAANEGSPSRFDPKFDKRTVQNQSYGAKPFLPSKSYAPTSTYNPNNSPLGVSTQRAEYLHPVRDF